MPRRDLLVLQIRHGTKSADAGLLRFFQGDESLLHDLSVLAEKRHDIGDRTQSHDVEVAGECPAAHLLPKRLTELERHADTGDIFVGIGAVSAVRVEDGERLRQLLARQVMVGDDDIDLFLRRRHLCHGGNAAVHRDDQRSSLRDDLVERFLVQPITVLLPMRNEVIAVGTKQPKIAAQERGRRDAVDVVVAVDDDALLPFDRPPDARDGGRHILHEEGIVKRLLFGMKKRARRLLRFYAAVQKKRRREGRRADALRKFHGSRRHVRQERPFLFHPFPPSDMRYDGAKEAAHKSDATCAQPFLCFALCATIMKITSRQARCPPGGASPRNFAGGPRRGSR